MQRHGFGTVVAQLIDGYGREITYLRVSVTDRCNFRCVYCMPEEGVPPKPHASILRYEEIARIARLAVSLGVRSIRITGGEPLVRRGIASLVGALAGLRSAGLHDLSMTTNGSLLAPVAQDLAAAGLDRVNISLDTLRADRFRRITRWGDLAAVLEGTGAALSAGLAPVKVNVVVTRDNVDEVQDFAFFAMSTGLQVRFIELMPLGHASAMQPGAYESAEHMKDLLEESGSLREAGNGGPGSGPARYYAWVPYHGIKPSPGAQDAAEAVARKALSHREGGAPAIVGFITAISSHFCPGCNRLRLTADGRLAPCLWSPEEVDIGTILRSGAPDEEIIRVLQSAVAAKPLEYATLGGLSRRRMSRLGG